MASAAGIAVEYAAFSAQTWRFSSYKVNPVGGAAQLISNDDISGTWSRSSNTITWAGTDPSFTISGTATVTALQISKPLGEVTCNIDHSDVALTDGDTIVYTSVQITFTTTDLPST